MSYASRLEHQSFPQVCMMVECERGSIELALDYWIRTTTKDGTFSKQCELPWYDWMDPTHQVVHASIVSCNTHLLRSLQTGRAAETTGADNLKTLQLVYGSYESAATRTAVLPGGTTGRC